METQYNFIVFRSHTDTCEDAQEIARTTSLNDAEEYVDIIKQINPAEHYWAEPDTTTATPEHQANLPSVQRVLEDFDRVFTPLSRGAHQQWTCPKCNTHHFNEPIEMNIYNCSQNECSFIGNRETLLIAGSAYGGENND